MRQKKLLLIISAILIIAAIYFIFDYFQKDNTKIFAELKGKWGGLLTTPTNQFLIYADFILNEDGMEVEISSPKQNKFSLPVDSLVFDKNNISFSLPKFNISYKGKFITDSSLIEGSWTQGKIETPLIFYKANELFRINRPQNPFKPYGYKSDMVEILRDSNISLAGTLTYPDESNSKFPAIILINGMGKQDRDETMYGHKPFLVLSNYFTKKGFAVLRVDDRGVGESTGNFDNATTQNFSSDVKAEINFLKNQNYIDSNKIGLLGFNEGGLVASIVASQNEKVSFVVLLSTPGIPGKEILLDQTRLLQEKQNVPDEEIKRDYLINKQMYNIVENVKDTSKAKMKLTKVYKNFKTSLPKEESMKKKYSSSTFNNFVKMMTTPWFRYYLTFNPEQYFTKIQCPVLIMYGENDLQVDPNKNLYVIKNALEKGGNDNYKSIIFPELNHLFQQSDTGLPTEYSKIEETFSTEVLDSISSWIGKIQYQ